MKDRTLVDKVICATDSFSKSAMILVLDTGIRYTTTPSIRDKVASLSLSKEYSGIDAFVPESYQAYLRYSKDGMSDFTVRNGRRGIALNYLGYDLLSPASMIALDTMKKMNQDFFKFELNSRDIGLFVKYLEVIFNKNMHNPNDILNSTKSSYDSLRHTFNLLSSFDYLKKAKGYSTKGNYPALSLEPTEKGRHAVDLFINHYYLPVIELAKSYYSK
jgi:hypothetical protein